MAVSINVNVWEKRLRDKCSYANEHFAKNFPLVPYIDLCFFSNSLFFLSNARIKNERLKSDHVKERFFYGY